MKEQQLIELTLSNHAADQSGLAASQRQANYETAMAGHREALEQREAKSVELRHHSRFCFEYGYYGEWLKSFVPRLAHGLSFAPIKPHLEAAGRDEILWNVGSEGENRVAQVLAQCLSDEWTLVSGYRNRKGEIDKLLIGPAGVLAIEVKNVSGRVSCQGNTWWRDKFDRYGNLVESNLPFRDNGGRSPAEQVTEPARLLEKFLNQWAGVPRVARTVILSHPSASLGAFEDLQIELVIKLEAIAHERAQSLPFYGLGNNTVDHIVGLVKRDHEYHEAQRRGARGS